MRKQLLDYVAGPIILRQQAIATDAPQDERDTALFRLLSRDLKGVPGVTRTRTTIALSTAKESLAVSVPTSPTGDQA